MQHDSIRRLYAYDRWANEQILNAAQLLTPAQFVTPDDTPFGSVRNELIHIFDVKRGWRIDWELALGKVPGNTDILNFSDYPDHKAVVEVCRSVEKRTEDFFESVNDELLARQITVEFDWGSISAPLWELMVHVVNHGTQHRSEVAMKLTNFGHSPGMVDLLFYTGMHTEADGGQVV